MQPEHVSDRTAENAMARVSGWKLNRLRSRTLALTAMVAAALSCAAAPALAQARQKFNFAVTFPLTGIAASQGETASKAVKIALQEINDHDYIGGVELVPFILDSEAKPDIGVRALEQAITVNGAGYVITGYSSVSAAQAPIAERSRVVLVNVGGASPVLSNLSPWFFNAIPLTHLQIPILLEEIIEVQHKKSVALLFRDDDLGRGIRSLFGASAQALGGKLVAEESYLPGTNDFRRQLARIRAGSPDMVYIAGVATEIGSIIGQAASLGLTPLWTSYGAYNHKATIELGKQAADGGIYTNPANFGANLKTLPRYEQMLSAWRTAYGSTSDLDYIAGQIYLGVYLLADTLKTLKSSGKALTPENIRDAMRTTKYETVTGPMTFDKHQDALTSIAIYRLEKSEFKPYKVYSSDDVSAINARVVKQ
ncbi:ABC transporter substrate-binding protein [Bradyrhizobium sp. LHD-71]|uniref:ABC transporter substrate-binding protein n=1 Tax=Bradyrhizobium sp. LHD-71 TaxID=3072141 RepID=UPI0028107AB7|nr:ABC transporter substrate-binding protein [Bradyrhizobium sp. LHD-71]MDQ8728201.1 ABC transporter substrate-binding protein [Bradyrhizobium sp. LHD-71]